MPGDMRSRKSECGEEGAGRRGPERSRGRRGKCPQEVALGPRLQSPMRSFISAVSLKRPLPPHSKETEPLAQESQILVAPVS